LKTALRLGATKHKHALPVFPHLKENNVRTGFIEQSDFDLLRGLATEPWLRLFLEMAFEYGWRKRELLDLRVRHANVMTGTIRLDVGDTKNDEGREVAMTASIRELVRVAATGKNPDESSPHTENDLPRLRRDRRCKEVRLWQICGFYLARFPQISRPRITQNRCL
jgi:integrase